MKATAPPPGFTPPMAPPSYAETVGGVPPTSPYIPNHTFQRGPEIVTTVVALGPRNTHMICPSCRAEIDTTIKTKPRLLAYISGAILCFVGLFCGCCLIPCCMDSCMITEHKCPNCKQFLGTYTRKF